MTTMEGPLVSVLMTAYNREKYIAEAIESVLASSYQQFELIIVDDGSSDQTVSIAQSYAARDPRIRVYLNPVNLGDYHNRNKAASYAAGKYIKYLDSDDMIYPHGLGIMVSAMERFPDAAVGIMSLENQEDKPFPFQLSPADAYDRNFNRKGFFDTGPSALIFHTERFREIGGFSGKRYVGDIEINLRLIRRWPAIKMASALVFWRQHEGQEFVIGSRTSGYFELLLPMYELELKDPGCPLPVQKQDAIIGYFRKLTARHVLNILLKKKDIREARAFYKKMEIRPVDIFNAIFFIKAKY